MSETASSVTMNLITWVEQRGNLYVNAFLKQWVRDMIKVALLTGTIYFSEVSNIFTCFKMNLNCGFTLKGYLLAKKAN